MGQLSPATIALHKALYDRSIDSIKRAVADGADVLAFKEDGYSPLSFLYDTIFTFDQRVTEPDARVEAWCEFRNNPASRTVYALPPGKKLRVKLDEHNDHVVIEETKIDGDEDLDDD